ncbi:sugar 3,4-ketoisomerase [Muribaculum intestinale]|uniref:sugar 3,4-ketoisomerase n=1 Tax=Muribaculum intestinale TaxID=1796646 RepID=UPI00242C56E5|nr:FdtA/QdtA family cupin domain-containing protein [Muribaculum intestinale]
MMTTVEDIKVTPFCKIADRRGNLTVAQSGTDLPFEIQRAYWVYDVPGGECRGGHAHKECQEMIISINGSFTLTLDDGVNRRSFLLNHPYEGVLVPVGIWRTLDDFSSGAVCMVLASHRYDEDDYIRSYDEYLKSRGLSVGR